MLDPINFQSVVKGKKTDLYRLSSGSMNVFVTNYGARIVSCEVPDKFGNLVDVVLGFDSMQKYIDADEQYHGAMVGRYANRIANGKFSIGKNEYVLAVNNGANALHGGIEAFHNKVWTVTKVDDTSIEMELVLTNMEEGYPGNLFVKANFTLSKDNELSIEVEAKGDKPTVVNITHHNYFNLMGEGSGKIHDTLLQINASKYTPLNENCIPTGEISQVIGTPFDFTIFKKIGQQIEDDNEQLRIGAGYDHNFALDGYESDVESVHIAAIATTSNGVKMTILTNQPGLQLYTGNWLSGKDTGKSGQQYHRRNAFCLEQQAFPDSPNQPNFPSTLLEPGETYYNICIQRFEVVAH